MLKFLFVCHLEEAAREQLLKATIKGDAKEMELVLHSWQPSADEINSLTNTGRSFMCISARFQPLSLLLSFLCLTSFQNFIKQSRMCNWNGNSS
jgi:hypothetical protein